ncbi:MAG: hypothetical protein ACK2UA_14405 [Anaerolineae bacterium]
MGKKLAFVTIIALTVLLVATPVLAGGDKNRGDVGTGAVEQHQVNWDVYESQRLVQNQEQVLSQNQEQLQVRVQVQLHKNSLKYTWF